MLIKPSVIWMAPEQWKLNHAPELSSFYNWTIREKKLISLP
ncbi:DUF6199 family natural product biosynthesis protein [Paenibacillus sp. Z6-24]